MLIPFKTDAPIYHLPIATILVMAINIGAFLTLGGLSVDANGSRRPDGIMRFDTIAPNQWITSVFLHMDFGHLLGNMFFLFVFGIVVEGKIGWWKFLSIYFFIAVLAGSIEQITMYLVSDQVGGSLGASGVIYGLMAIALIWAPQNNISCLVFIFLRPFVFELSIVAMAGLYVGLQLGTMFFTGARMSSEMLHLVGFASGIPFGLALLKLDWVECEGWDFVNIYITKGERRNKTRDRQRAARLASQSTEAKDQKESQLRQLNRTIQQAIVDEQPVAAIAIYDKHRDTLQSGKGLSNEALTQLAKVVQQHKRWELAVPLLVEWIRRLPPQKAVSLRLNLALILVDALDRPKQAIAVLEKLPTPLSAQHTRRGKQIAAAARKAMAEGSYEVDIQDW